MGSIPDSDGELPGSMQEAAPPTDTPASISIVWQAVGSAAAIPDGGAPRARINRPIFPPPRPNFRAPSPALAQPLGNARKTAPPGPAAAPRKVRRSSAAEEGKASRVEPTDVGEHDLTAVLTKAPVLLSILRHPAPISAPPPATTGQALARAQKTGSPNPAVPAVHFARTPVRPTRRTTRPRRGACEGAQERRSRGRPSDRRAADSCLMGAAASCSRSRR